MKHLLGVISSLWRSSLRLAPGLTTGRVPASAASRRKGKAWRLATSLIVSAALALATPAQTTLAQDEVEIRVYVCFLVGVETVWDGEAFVSVDQWICFLLDSFKV